MPEQYVGRLVPDMDVCDLDGHKLGKVARVYRDEFSVFASVANAGAAQRRPDRPDVMEVKTGLFGLGGRLYIPLTAIQQATERCVFVAKKPGDHSNEWQHKPGYLDQLC